MSPCIYAERACKKNLGGWVPVPWHHRDQGGALSPACSGAASFRPSDDVLYLRSHPRMKVCASATISASRLPAPCSSTAASCASSSIVRVVEQLDAVHQQRAGGHALSPTMQATVQKHLCRSGFLHCAIAPLTTSLIRHTEVQAPVCIYRRIDLRLDGWELCCDRLRCE